ncbi:MAG: hypothetical protein WED11_10315 [Natronospirillum sp.]
MLVNDIDRKIEEFRGEIEKLESKRAAEAKKFEGMEAFEGKVQSVCDEYGLTRDELYLSKGDEIVSWVKALSKLPDRPEVYNELKSYFARVIAREGTGKKVPAKAKSTGPKLEVGSYKNPHSGEVIEKIKRNPKTLDGWLTEYGFATVQGWKV